MEDLFHITNPGFLTYMLEVCVYIYTSRMEHGYSDTHFKIDQIVITTEV